MHLNNAYIRAFVYVNEQRVHYVYCYCGVHEVSDDTEQ